MTSAFFCFCVYTPAERCVEEGKSKRPGTIKSTGAETILPDSLDCSCCLVAEWWLPSRLLLLLLFRLRPALSSLSELDRFFFFFFLSDFFLNSTIQRHCWLKNCEQSTGQTRIDIRTYSDYSAPFVSLCTCAATRPVWNGSRIPLEIRLGVGMTWPVKCLSVRSIEANLTAGTKRPRTRHPTRFRPFPPRSRCRCKAAPLSFAARSPIERTDRPTRIVQYYPIRAAIRNNPPPALDCRRDPSIMNAGHFHHRMT